MALPYLDKKKIAAAVIAKQMKDGRVVNEHAEPVPSPMLEHAKAILNAVKEENATRLAEVLEQISAKHEELEDEQD